MENKELKKNRENEKNEKDKLNEKNNVVKEEKKVQKNELSQSKKLKTKSINIPYDQSPMLRNYKSKVNFKSESERKLFQEYIHDYLRRTDILYYIKVKLIKVIDKSLKYVANKEASEIDTHDLYKCVESSYVGVTPVIMGYLEFLKNNDVKISKDVELLISYKGYMNRNYRLAFLRILSREHIERWHYNTFETPSQKLNVNYYINVPVEYEIYGFLAEFTKKYQALTKELDVFLSDFLVPTPNIKSVKDLSYETFIKQLNYCYEKTKNNRNCHTVSFYLFVFQKTGIDIFSDGPVPTRVLNMERLGTHILNGYKLVTYNPISDVPNEDKLIISLPIKETRKNYTNSNSFAINLTNIKNENYRKWVKDYLWKYPNSNFDIKVNNISPQRIICNQLTEIEENYHLDSKDYDITADLVKLWKLNLTSKKRGRHISTRCSDLSVLLNFAMEYEHATVENEVFYYLKNDTYNCKAYNSNPIPNSDLNKLVNVAIKKIDESMKNEMCYCLLCLLLNTSIRTKDLVNLERDCIRDTLKNGEYGLITSTKTSHNQDLDLPLPVNAKRIIEHLQNLSDSISNKCNDIRFKNKLFLYENKSKRLQYSVINTKLFNDYLLKCCEEAKIKQYSAQNLRDTYMTNSEKYRISKGFSDMYDKILTGHANHETTEKHYVKMDFKTVYEATQGIIIGNIDLSGKIVKDVDSDIEKIENSVEEDTGYCVDNTCKNMTFLSCYLCPHFITSPRQLNQFKKQYEEINKQILKAKLPHDKKDLCKIRELIANYIVKIEEVINS